MALKWLRVEVNGPIISTGNQKRKQSLFLDIVKRQYTYVWWVEYKRFRWEADRENRGVGLEICYQVLLVPLRSRDLILKAIGSYWRKFTSAALERCTAKRKTAGKSICSWEAESWEKDQQIYQRRWKGPVYKSGNWWAIGVRGREKARITLPRPHPQHRILTWVNRWMVLSFPWWG